MVECKTSGKKDELKTLLSFKHASGENISLLVQIWFNLAILLSTERMAISLLTCATNTDWPFREGKVLGGITVLSTSSALHFKKVHGGGASAELRVCGALQRSL